MAKTKERIKAIGATPARLSEIDNTVFKNIRTVIDDSELFRTMNDIDLNGLIHFIAGERQANGKIGLSCGFCRFEILQRLATRKVLDEYNEKMGFKPGDEGFIALNGQNKENFPEGTKVYRVTLATMQKGREKIREVSTEWKEKYDAALAAYETTVNLFEYKSPREAMLHNAGENTNRSDPSLLDHLSRIEEMIEQDFSGKEIAAVMHFSESQVTHLKRVARLVPALRDMITEYKKPDGEEQEAHDKFITRAKALVDELERRLALPEDDKCVIKFRHARDLSGAVIRDDGPSLPVVCRILTALVQLNVNAEPTEEATPDTGTFESRMKDIIKQSKAVAEPVADPAAAAAPAAEVSPVNPAAQVETGEKANAPAAPTLAPADLIAQAAKIAEAQAATATQPVPVDQAAQGVTAGANAEAQKMVDGIDLDQLVSGGIAEPTAAELAAVTQEDGTPATPPPGEKVIDPITRQKTGSAPETKFKPVAPEKLEANAVTILKGINDDNVSPVDMASYLLSSHYLMWGAGLDKQADVLNEAYTKYAEEAQLYIMALEEAVQKFANDESKASVAATKPAKPVVNLG